VCTGVHRQTRAHSSQLTAHSSQLTASYCWVRCHLFTVEDSCVPSQCCAASGYLLQLLLDNLELPKLFSPARKFLQKSEMHF